MARYFGTDGIRGIVPQSLNYEMAFALGNGLSKLKNKPNIIIGCDTRSTSDYLVTVISAGIIAGGGIVSNCGVCSTPKLSYLTKEFNCDFGVMVSASHNGAKYNGIKVFNTLGEKVSEHIKELLEESIFSGLIVEKDYLNIGRLKKLNTTNKYEQFLIDKSDNLNNLKIAIDCANGATRGVGEIFKALGGEIIELFNKPNGYNINENCGALHPQCCVNAVKENKCDIGFCFDGDGDRVIAITGCGQIVDGDGIIYCLAKWYQKRGILLNNTVVGTKQSNYGLEMALNNMGINFVRADVGDSYVVEKMHRRLAIIGGESSGHIIIGDKIFTGDGVLVALTLCNILIAEKTTLKEYMNFEYYPSTTINVEVKSKNTIIRDEKLLAMIQEKENHLKDKGRILIRMSGTEEIIRVLVECNNKTMCDDIAKCIANLIEHIDMTIQE